MKIHMKAIKKLAIKRRENKVLNFNFAIRSRVNAYIRNKKGFFIPHEIAQRVLKRTKIKSFTLGSAL